MARVDAEQTTSQKGETSMAITEQETHDQVDINPLEWGPDTPRGGKAVMGRILKESATVPLFFGQTMIQSLRDVGYNHTTSALCEHVDNAIQAKATEIRVYFRQSGKRGEYQIDTAVYDNGLGMAPTVLKVATSFGGSTTFGNRKGIGRFGMGMKTAALSLSPVMELYSWQERGAIYNMTLDVDSVGKDRRNLVELPEPTLLTQLPDEVAELFKKLMVYPADRNEQDLLALDDGELEERLGRSGTIVYMPQCDRLTYAKASTLVDHAVKEMARIYRRALGVGLKLFVNNRRVEAFDPTYSMSNARHTRIEDLQTKLSRLIVSKPVEIKISENSKETAPVTIKLYKLPVEEWSSLTRKTLRNDLKVFEGYTVSILRNEREVFAGSMPWLTGRHSSYAHWYRIQIDFPGVLDEAFGVATNKQGVRLKGYVEKAIKDAIGEDISTITEEITRFQAQRASSREPAKPSASETQAAEADPFQRETMPGTLSPEEEAQIDGNLRGLALTLKRDGETDDEAFERIKSSKYIIDFKHDEYWPFYDVKHHFGRILLTINTAHPFFTELYDPVRKMGSFQGGADGEEAIPPPSRVETGPLLALDLLLLSLARTQSRLAGTSDQARDLLDSLRREWSDTYRLQLKA
jgi:hypothetical protein